MCQQTQIRSVTGATTKAAVCQLCFGKLLHWILWKRFLWSTGSLQLRRRQRKRCYRHGHVQIHACTVVDLRTVNTSIECL